MDLAVILPLAALLACQVLLALFLLAPRAVSKHVASLLVLTKTNTVCSTALHTTAVALLAITISSLIQLLGIRKTMAAPQYDGALALTIEELRALLSVVLGVSDLVLLFTLRALADEQLTADKATLNLQVLRKQAMGQQTEYMRATTGSGQGGSSCGTTDSSSKSEVSKLIADKHKMLQELDDAKAEAAAATKNLAAVKAQAQGLEREYDRLLAEHDGLQRKLARLGGGGQQFAADKKSA